MEESDFSEGPDEGQDSQEEELDPSHPDYALFVVERTFNKTISEIEKNPEAAQYADDFYRLFENFYQTHRRHKEFEEKYNKAVADIQEKNTSIESAIKLADFDKNTINDLKVQIEHAWKLADAAHAREQAAQESIDNLRKQIESLNAEIEFRNKMGEETTEE